jgi:hypothetical protein
MVSKTRVKLPHKDKNSPGVKKTSGIFSEKNRKGA